MKYIVNAAKMKAIDQYSIEEIGIPAMVLMEQAAMSVAAVIRNSIKPSDRILSVCGTGNNGGDGIAAARILSEYGYQVSILLLGDEAKQTVQTRHQLSIAKKLDINIINNGRISEYNVIIDAIFGIGLTKPVSGEWEKVIKDINNSPCNVYSVDIPSGVHTDDGKIMNIAVKADTTITFGLNKQGLLLYPGCLFAGEIVVADIGFPNKALTQAGPNTFTYDEADLRRLPVRKSYSNKGTYGKVLVIAGSKNMSGACYLSAKAAYRAGAGLVRVLTAEENRTIIQTSLPEAILTTYDEEKISNQKDSILQAIKWATVIVIGPGIGTSKSADIIFKMVLQYGKVPVVIDADAINLLSANDTYRDEQGKLMVPPNTILTPHLKEMSRLTNQSTTEIAENLINTVLETVNGNNSVIVLKDARTIVSDGNKVYLNLSGNHGLATGGSGDVLSGIIAAFLAQGLDHFQASTLGVYVHGLAGDYVTSEGNSYSLIASDIIEALIRVLDTKDL